MFSFEAEVTSLWDRNMLFSEDWMIKKKQQQKNIPSYLWEMNRHEFPNMQFHVTHECRVPDSIGSGYH